VSNLDVLLSRGAGGNIPCRLSAGCGLASHVLDSTRLPAGLVVSGGCLSECITQRWRTQVHLRFERVGIAQNLYDEMVRDSIAPRMKARRFKKTRTNFHRSVGPNWEVVNLQRSTYSDAGHVMFTVNLGVALESIRGTVRFSGWKEGTRPTEYDCHLRERIGFVIGDRDTWWDIYPETEVAALGDAVAEAIERFGLPWLERHSDDVAFRDRALADIKAIRHRDFVVVKRLIERFGPAEALSALEDEWATRPQSGRHPWSQL